MSRSLLVVALSLLGACDRVFGLDERPAASDAGADPDADALPCFEDAFRPASIDTSKWGPYMQQNTMVSVDGRLVVTLDSTGGAAYAGIQSVVTHDTTGASTEIEIVGYPPPPIAPASSTGAETYMEWTLDQLNYYAIGVDGDEVFFEQVATGAVTRSTARLNRADPERHWRIAHDKSSNTVEFWTKTETGAWTLRESYTARFKLDKITIEVASGTYVDFDAPGAAAFDNFQMFCP